MSPETGSAVDDGVDQRRRHPRYTLDLPGTLSFAQNERESPPITCKIVDLSRYGIRFVATSPIQSSCGERIEVCFSSPRAIPATVRILRSQPLDGSAFIYAGELTFPHEDARRKMHTFLSALPKVSIQSRRKYARRQSVRAVNQDRRVADRRRDFGIFAACVRFSHRVADWRKSYTLFLRSHAERAGRIWIDGQELVSFGSKDYLGLSHDTRVKEAVIQAVAHYGTHSTGSRAVNGIHPQHEELENEINKILGTEATIIFNSGYLANFAILGALLQKDDVAFADDKVHASMLDGCVASGARLVRFRHNSAEDLEDKIKRAKHSRSLILVEGVYSTEGDLGCLPDIKCVASAHGIPVMLDDGHAFAILGRSGAGTPEHFGIHEPVDLYVGLFSKALAGNGGFLSCSGYIADYVSHFSRGMIFTTTLPPAMMAGVLQALRIVRSEPQLRHKLFDNVKRLKVGLESIGYDVRGGASAILAIRVGHEQHAYDMVRKMQERGIHVNTFVRPAVRRGEAVIRLTVCATHTTADLDIAIEAFSDLKPWLDRMQA